MNRWIAWGVVFIPHLSFRNRFGQSLFGWCICVPVRDMVMMGSRARCFDLVGQLVVSWHDIKMFPVSSDLSSRGSNHIQLGGEITLPETGWSGHLMRSKHLCYWGQELGLGLCDGDRNLVSGGPWRYDSSSKTHNPVQWKEVTPGERGWPVGE